MKFIFNIEAGSETRLKIHIIIDRFLKNADYSGVELITFYQLLVAFLQEIEEAGD